MDWKVFKSDGSFWAEHKSGKCVCLASFTKCARLGGLDYIEMRLADVKAIHAARQAEPKRSWRYGD